MLFLDYCVSVVFPSSADKEIESFVTELISDAPH